MFKHHRPTFEVHSTGSVGPTGGTSPLLKTPAPAAPAKAPEPAPKAGAPAAAPAPADAVQVGEQQLTTGKKAKLAAFDEDGDGHFSDAELSKLADALKEEKAEAEKIVIPPVPPYDAADKSVKPVDKQKQLDAKAWFDALPPAEKAQAIKDGFPADLKIDGKEGPLTRAALNAKAVGENRAATQKAEARQAEQAKKAEETKKQDEAQKQEDRFKQLEETHQRERTVDKATSDIGRLADKKDWYGMGQKAGELANQYPDAVNLGMFEGHLGGKAAQKFVEACNDPAKLDKVPIEVRRELLKQTLEDAEDKGGVDHQHRLAILTASLERGGDDMGWMKQDHMKPEALRTYNDIVTAQKDATIAKLQAENEALKKKP